MSITCKRPAMPSRFFTNAPKPNPRKNREGKAAITFRDVELSKFHKILIITS